MKVVIIGHGPYAKMIQRYIKMTTEWEILGFAVDPEYATEDPEYDVYDVNKLKEYFNSEIKLIMGVGYTQMGNVRKSLYYRCKEQGFDFERYVHPSAIISPNAIVGEGTNILEGCILEESAAIGVCGLIFGGSVVAHETKIGDFITVSINSSIAGCSSIGDNCFFGAGSVARDHICIGDYVLIGANAYAFGDIPAHKVVKASRCSIISNEDSLDFL